MANLVVEKKQPSANRLGYGNCDSFSDTFNSHGETLSTAVIGGLVHIIPSSKDKPWNARANLLFERQSDIDIWKNSVSIAEKCLQATDYVYMLRPDNKIGQIILYDQIGKPWIAVNKGMAGIFLGEITSLSLI